MPVFVLRSLEQIAEVGKVMPQDHIAECLFLKLGVNHSSAVYAM